MSGDPGGYPFTGDPGGYPLAGDPEDTQFAVGTNIPQGVIVLTSNPGTIYELEVDDLRAPLIISNISLTLSGSASRSDTLGCGLNLTIFNLALKS